MNSFEPEPPLPIRIDLDEHTGPALRLPRERAAAMIEAALADFSAVPAPAQRRVNPWQLTAAAAVLVLAVVGGAAAARYYFDFGHEPAPQPTAARTQPSAASTLPVEPPVAAQAPDEAADSESTAQGQATPLAAATKTARAAAVERVAPEDLLQRANRLRASGQFRDAAQTYALVYDRFPRSASAYVAHVAAASIELEHLSNPLRARRLFEQALREQPHGALDLEARQGLCVALRDLEDRPAETRALQSLMETHPDSPAARRAQVRLHETESERR